MYSRPHSEAAAGGSAQPPGGAESRRAEPAGTARADNTRGSTRDKPIARAHSAAELDEHVFRLPSERVQLPQGGTPA